MFVVKRDAHNPILTPNHAHFWEGSAAFNPTPVIKGRKKYLLYRALSTPDVLRSPRELSTIGIAESTDGKQYSSHRQFIAPVEEWEKYGCEDPRTTYFEGKYYTFYTALGVFPFGPSGIKCAVAVSKDLETVESRHLVTPFNAKAMTLFPGTVNGKVTIMFSVHTDAPPAKMCIRQFDRIEELWDPKSWEGFEENIDTYAIDLRRMDSEHVEVGAAPIKTKYGWLLIYSHVQNYFSDEKVFGVEAVLLDLHDPRRVIGRTKGPFLVPEEPYEHVGLVPNIVFPSGATVEGDALSIYYGAADSTGCVAHVSLFDLISTLHPELSSSHRLKRFFKNPILTPTREHPWEEQAVLNPGALKIKKTTYLFYRAISGDNTSTIGLATTEDGVTITKRLADPIYTPRTPHEMKKVEGGNSGCEDPRVSKIGDRIYMCYTAFDGIGPPRVAVTSILEKDFLSNNFNWATPELLTPYDVDDKDGCVVPEKIGNKYFVLHRIGTDICGDFLPTLEFEKYKVNKCIRILGPRPGMWDGVKTGIAGPPIKTKKGWLLLYHAISKEHHTYRVGAVLLDLKDPTIILARSSDPIFEPEEEYEKVGVVNRVVFPCGMVEEGKNLYVYYGGADKVIGVATIETKVLLDALTREHLKR
ncbi:MAG: hypothetical protein V4465_00930 [Patescibacteria group bacterium]